MIDRRLLVVARNGADPSNDDTSRDPHEVAICLGIDQRLDVVMYDFVHRYLLVLFRRWGKLDREKVLRASAAW